MRGTFPQAFSCTVVESSRTLNLILSKLFISRKGILKKLFKSRIQPQIRKINRMMQT